MTDRFRDDQPQHNPSISLPLPMATDDTMMLNRWACKGLEVIFKTGYQYKKAGVILGEITHKSVFQTDLFESAQESPELILAMDGLNGRFGKGTIGLSQDGSKRKWAMRQDRKSPDYTTNWDEMAGCH
jgi:DNA polymerase V